MGDGGEEYLIDFFFKIFGEWLSDDGGDELHEVEAGEVHLRLVRLSAAADDEVSFAALFDLDETMSDLSLLFDWEAESWDFKTPVLKACPEVNSFSDLFVIENLILRPWARRQGLRLRIIELLLKNWQSGCSLAAIKPFPLQAGMNADSTDELEIDDLESSSKDPEEGIKGLSQYYRKLGFKSVPGCPYLVRSLELRSPSVDNLDLAECLMVPSEIAKKVETASGN